ncbi:MAG: RsmB/NOP family class I SAM-dependent RNA methyltransferase [Rhodothermales bacterium]|nr:RsmB/NOP family class I SAM-dependent RNA methyltransferase [Rhodothermales bacterium]
MVLTTEKEFPQAFLDRLTRIVPPGMFREIRETMEGPRAVGFRVNRLRPEPEAVVAQLDIPVTPLPWVSFGFLCAPEDRWKLLESPAFLNGDIWVQNPSSMVPPVVLDPDPADKVLDLAASPGSKTLQLAEMMGHGADIAAVELSRSRFYRLKRNLRTHEAAFVKTFNRDGIKVQRYRPGHFDKVLIDAPCSTEGQMRTDAPNSFSHWSPRKVKTMAGKQRLLLESAINCAKAGGVVVYSTCSFAPEENEAVIQHALDTFGSAITIEPIGLDLPTRTPALREWEGQTFDPRISRTVRVLPDTEFEAFFVCRFRKLEHTHPF